ncbi:MAG: hypothetical protein HC785_07180 [Calothrix sp. CSU_2_0]|nr:hypothetical protein [Calothrix sp. CSU_2_0]
MSQQFFGGIPGKLKNPGLELFWCRNSFLGNSGKVEKSRFEVVVRSRSDSF